MKSSILWTITPLDVTNTPTGRQRLFMRSASAKNFAKSIERCLIEKHYYGSIEKRIRKKYKAWVSASSRGVRQNRRIDA